MKLKFTAALALAIWLAVTGWLATMVIAKPAILHLGNSADETASMAELRSAIERNRQARDQIASLRQSSFSDGGRPLIALQSALPAAGGNTTYSGYATVQDGGAPAALDVSMVLDTDGRRSAIVDGQRVRAGSRLADGSRVRAIGAGWVRIERPDGERIDRPVPSPLQQQGKGAPE